MQALLPRLNGAVDLLIFNPPYVPTPDEEVGRGGIAAAWARGARGRVIIDQVMPQVRARQGHEPPSALLGCIPGF